MSEQVAPRGPKPPPIPDRSGQTFEAKKRWRTTPITITGRVKKSYYWLYEAEGKDIWGKTFTFTIGELVLAREYRRKKE